MHWGPSCATLWTYGEFPRFNKHVADLTTELVLSRRSMMFDRYHIVEHNVVLGGI